MSDLVLPPPSDPVLVKLQRALYLQIVHDLTGMLPMPEHETVDEHIRRMRVAIAQAAALRPANPDEARIAARYVATGAHADECLRLAAFYAEHPLLMAQHHRQAGLMLRESRGARALLLRVQAVRYKRDGCKDPQQQDEWTEHVALESMMQALQELAPAPRRAPPPAPPPPRPAAAPRPAPAPPRQRRTDAEMFRVLASMTGEDGLPAMDKIMRMAGSDDEDIFFREPDPAGGA
jgi:hypothetical protein